MRLTLRLLGLLILCSVFVPSVTTTDRVADPACGLRSVGMSDTTLSMACQDSALLPAQSIQADLPWQMPPIILRIPNWVPRPRIRWPRRPETQQPADDSNSEPAYAPRSPAYRPRSPENRDDSLPAARDTQRPYDYEMFSNRVIHVPRSALPVAIYSNNPAAARAVQTAIDDWNRVGEQVGLGPMFRAASSPDDAQFTIDWSGRGLSGRVVGETQLRYSRGRARVEGVVMRPYSSLGSHAPEVLAHELGHALGLGHSAVRADLMYTTAHGYPGYIRFTARDVQMVQWLYSQSEYIPIGSASTPSAD